MSYIDSIINEYIMGANSKTQFLGHVLGQFDTVEDETIPAAGVTIQGGNVILYWNPKTFPLMKEKEQNAVLDHEALHVMLEHMARVATRDQKLWNYATDATINKDLSDLPDWVFHAPEDWKLPKDYSEEECYDKIPLDFDPNRKGGGKQPGGEGDDPTQSSHKYWKDSDPSEIQHATIKDIVSKAVQRNKGNVPGDFQSMVDALLKSKMNWRSILKYFMSSKTRHKSEVTYKRRNRRKVEHPIIWPGRRKSKGLDIIVVADTSGSMMNEKDTKMFFTELEAIAHQTEAKIRLMQWDCDLCHHDDIYKKGDFKKIGYKGGGGTSFVTFPDYIEEHKYKPDVVVFYTDCRAFFPDKEPEGYTIIWASITDDKAPWGINLRIKE